ncbi:ABC transporter permease [Spirochaeta africana]|uniref:ABC-type dipeptide/oligopeptide/nickel transport system, permease component n=1 Tax=Spirochaeta africana (strain ATCC 700263 / DSM 8902 / Z-7692) TaxID=889378 RepID=H9UKS8_SPIAZ|nr:ABC transporter permease [Spirochaeta africana]AFG38121.1 ABC-type dipeptide/oligopeptide/nickel transport system, permease component [Spirochaeta africana DSM 8902]
MYQYIARRLLLTIPVVIGVSIIVFALIRMIPGDPARAIAGVQATPEYIEQIRTRHRLDEPLHIQYGYFAWNAMRGDLGRSTFSRRPVAVEIGERFPRTMLLASLSLIVATLVGVSAGIVSATRRNSLFDNLSMILALVGVAAPVFWLALMFQLLFSVQLGMLPATGIGTWRHVVLPSITLGLASAALMARITRSSMLDVLRQEFITTARAKGLGERIVIYKHALKNALIPVVTVLGLQFGLLLGGAVLTETVFAWPGIGRLLVDAILRRDYPVVQGTILFLALLFVLINLVVDIIYAYLDPRIHYHGGGE